jgi:hypothetical protein
VPRLRRHERHNLGWRWFYEVLWSNLQKENSIPGVSYRKQLADAILERQPKLDYEEILFRVQLLREAIEQFKEGT